MSVSQILNGLERSPATGAEADAIARLGFLEWVFASPGVVTAKEARKALTDPAMQNPTSAAARAFVEVLQEATQADQLIPMRRGRAARVMH